MLTRVHKNKSMQRLISSLWGTGTAKFQGTWLLHIVQKGVSMSQCCAVDRWLMSGAYRCKPKSIYRAFPFFFSSWKLTERVHKGKKVRLFKDRHTQSTKGASIARKCTRLGRRVLRHQPLQVFASSCIMTCFHAPRWPFDTQSVLVYLLPKMGLRKSCYLKFRRARPQCVVLHTLVLMCSWC